MKARRVGPAHPRLYLTIFFCFLPLFSLRFFRGRRVARGDTPL